MCSVVDGSIGGAEKAHLVYIADKHPKPNSLKNFAEQTVVWFMEEGEHVTITTRRQFSRNIDHT